MTFKYSLVVSENYVGWRLDKFLIVAVKVDNYSRTWWKQAITDHAVLVNDKPTIPAKILALGDTVTWFKTLDSTILKQKATVPVIYATADFAVINKPSPLLVHPTNNKHQITMVNYLAYQFGDLMSGPWAIADRAGVVHRLDKFTTGVLLIAFNQANVNQLQYLFKTRQVEKQYYALVEGLLDVPELTINLPLTKTYNKNTVRQRVSLIGKEAQTVVKVIKLYRKSEKTLIQCKIATGRTHQIRAHLAALGYPLVNDYVYSDKPTVDNYYYLHAYQLALTDPFDNKAHVFKAPLPARFKAKLAWLQAQERQDD